MAEGDDEAIDNRHQCVDCGAVSPATETSFTLISARHGWRLTRSTDQRGVHVMEWRCPACWQKHKADP